MGEEKKYVPEGQQSLGHSHVPFLIAKIHDQVKLIPPEQLVALEAIQMTLTVINIYAHYVAELKKELNKCASLNQHQAQMLDNKGIIR